ncbi:MAG: sialate O-acetylesterase [Armatimonadota bacterium]
MRKLILPMLVLVCICVTSSGVMANVNVNGLFSDNAVLQQGMSVPVWGSARDGERVTVEFQDQRVHTTAHDGKWMVRLRPLKPGGPFVMRITGDNAIELRNVMVGEVWLCSGQSNMIWTLGMSSNASRDVPEADAPMLRLFQVPPVTLDQPSDKLESNWRACTPDTARDFSAVAYFFGRELRRAKGVPIGLINASGAATMIQAFMPREVLDANPDFQPVFQLTFPPELQRLRPCGAYNGMVHPLEPYAVRGTIWYQGEANTHESALYRTLFPSMIKAWRSAWGQGDFPFLFVQLPPFESQEQIAFPRENEWAEMREAQLFVSKTVPNTAMVVTTDVGERHNIHPTNKEPVGRRLAMTALVKVYGDKGVGSGPVYRSMVVKNSRAVLSFDSTGAGLEARGGELTGFTIAGDDMKFVPAHASIQGERVVVSNPEVPHPTAVRYGWSNYPEVNLFNKDGFPASPFRTDGP